MLTITMVMRPDQNREAKGKKKMLNISLMGVKEI